MFYSCFSLYSLPDISKWDIKNFKYKNEIHKIIKYPTQFKKKKLFEFLLKNNLHI